MDDGIPKTPTEDMDFLDGYLHHIYDSDDLPDGAWFCALQELIEDQWPEADGHESLMAYFKWKNENGS